VSDILKNQVYTGCYVFGRGRHGKFHQLADDGSIVRGGKVKKRMPPIVAIKGHHPALVDEATFEKVQAKLTERRKEKRRPSSRHYPLSGLLKCGHCGAIMSGGTNVDNAKNPVRYYRCTRAPCGLCLCRRLNSEAIESQMVAIVQDVLLGPETEGAFRSELTAAAKRRKTASPAKTTETKARLAKLEKQIKRGTENLLLADPEDVPAAQKLLKEWRAEREQLQADLDAQSSRAPQLDGPVDLLVEKAMDAIRGLQERLSDVAPAKAREGFRQLFESITVFWHPRPPGQRNHRLARIVIQAKLPDGFCAGNAPSALTPTLSRRERESCRGLDSMWVGCLTFTCPRSVNPRRTNAG
jgi:hypothetical protein